MAQPGPKAPALKSVAKAGDAERPIAFSAIESPHEIVGDDGRILTVHCACTLYDIVAIATTQDIIFKYFISVVV